MPRTFGVPHRWVGRLTAAFLVELGGSALAFSRSARGTPARRSAAALSSADA